MNGTTLIEPEYKNRKDLHQGIFVDIFIIHKCPANNKFLQKLLYYQCHFILGITLKERGIKQKTLFRKMVFMLYKILPTNLIVKHVMEKVYKYDTLTDNYKYCFFLDKGKFKAAVYDAEQFENPSEYQFENVKLYGLNDLDKHLKSIYGDYMKLPPIEERQRSVHGMISDPNKDYTEYIK